MHAQKQLWALREQLRLRDDALAQATATAASQAKEVGAKLAGLAAQLARVHTSCRAGRGAMPPSQLLYVNRPGNYIGTTISL